MGIYFSTSASRQAALVCLVIELAAEDEADAALYAETLEGDDADVAPFLVVEDIFFVVGR